MLFLFPFWSVTFHWPQTAIQPEAGLYLPRQALRLGSRRWSLPSACSQCHRGGSGEHRQARSGAALDRRNT